MEDTHDWINPKNQIIGRQKIFDEHAKQIPILIKSAIRDACHIDNQPNVWEALQRPSSQAYLEKYSRQNPQSPNIGALERYLDPKNSNNYIVVIDLLIKILDNSTIVVGENGIESILLNSENKAVSRNYNTCNQAIRAKLDQIRTYLNNPKHVLPAEECLTSTLRTLITAEKELKKDSLRVDSQVLAIKSAEKLRNLSGAVGISISALSYLLKFKYAEWSYFAGLIPTGYAMLQHADYLAILRQLTKAKA